MYVFTFTHVHIAITYYTFCIYVFMLVLHVWFFSSAYLLQVCYAHTCNQYSMYMYSNLYRYKLHTCTCTLYMLTIIVISVCTSQSPGNRLGAKVRWGRWGLHIHDMWPLVQWLPQQWSDIHISCHGYPLQIKYIWTHHTNGLHSCKLTTMQLAHSWTACCHIDRP